MNKFFAECCAKNPRKKNTRQIEGSPSVKKTLDKEGVSRVFYFLHSSKNKNHFSGKEGEEKKLKKNFAECPDLGHSAKDKILLN